ncbi:uncharacterized protein RJT21DRAFT_123470 [Scheffersomyces amazonensis]|uniref:uncharacterized protein n=1 Tax=Scheffersomyces amazonensis TaxID=1078765 RepID=UPI00315CB416
MVFVKKFNFFSQVLINKFFIEYFKVFEDRLNWFTIKDHVDVHFDNLYSFNHLINIENLQLHMFNSKKLIQHLSSTVVPDPMTASSFGLLYSNLKSLDLSYNTLNDLTSIKFPSSLEYLNLSNNNIINLNNSTFNWKNLTNLKYLNLSNNTLVSFNLFNTISSNEFIEKEEYNLQKIDLSGNNLINLNFLSSKACVLFKNLTTIDLSRNLISDLVKFTGSLRSINLTGNYLDELNESHFDFSYYFPSNMTEINLSYCKLHNTNQIESELIKACPGLTKLNLEGNSKLPKIEVTPSA